MEREEEDVLEVPPAAGPRKARRGGAEQADMDEGLEESRIERGKRDGRRMSAGTSEGAGPPEEGAVEALDRETTEEPERMGRGQGAGRLLQAAAEAAVGPAELIRRAESPLNGGRRAWSRAPLARPTGGEEPLFRGRLLSGERGSEQLLEQVRAAERESRFVSGERRTLSVTLPETAQAGGGWSAEELDRAVERDARRYDGGFALY